MTTGISQTNTAWSANLLHASRELQEVHNALLPGLDAMAQEDFSRLFNSASRLQEMLDDPEQAQNTHDLMNVLGAIRGYAEMLREDLGSEQPQLDAGLAQLLEAVQAAQPGESVATTAESRVIESEPGFILAVDDLQENRELVARNLSRIGHFVVTAASGKEALQALEQSDVDVVLLDLIMPGMDGGKTFDYIREKCPQIPVLLSSGYAMNGQAEKIMNRGCDGFIQKPFSVYELSQKIRKILDKKTTSS